MQPMTLEETTGYLRHHTRLAGRSDTLFSDVIRGRQRASATAGDGPGLPVSPSVADGLSGEPPPRGQPTTELILLWPLVDAAFALPVTDAYVRALPAAIPDRKSVV